MINNLLPDPRQGITKVLLSFIKTEKFAIIAMNEVSNTTNSQIHRLMALKFIKSVFTLNDREIKAQDLLSCVASIISEMRDKQRNVNMLQSAAIELVNVFCDHVKTVYGVDEFKMISAIYMDEFDHAKNLLTQMFNTGKRTRSQA